MKPPRQNEQLDWLCVLDIDGRIAGVDGGAPPSWIGRRFDECPGMSEDVVSAARELMRSRTSPDGVVRRRRVPASRPDEPDLTLLTIEAVLLYPSSVELETLVKAALDPMARQAEPLDITIRVTAAPDLPACVVDQAKISWAVTAVVGNALLHVRRGTRLMPGGNIKVTLGHARDRSMVSITIEDDGPGMPSAVKSYLFEPNPKTGKTTGLALRLVHEIVVAHGGGMVVKSSTEPGDRGTSITIWLPTRTTAPLAPPAQ